MTGDAPQVPEAPKRKRAPRLTRSQLLKKRQLAPITHALYVKAENGLKIRSQRVRRLVQKMHRAMPWLCDADLPACRAWAELEILGARAFAELETRGLLNTEGEPRRLLADYRAIRRTQLQYEAALGMTPASRMTLRVGDSRARSLDLVGALAAEAATHNRSPEGAGREEEET